MREHGLRIHALLNRPRDTVDFYLIYDFEHERRQEYLTGQWSSRLLEEGKIAEPSFSLPSTYVPQLVKALLELQFSSLPDMKVLIREIRTRLDRIDQWVRTWNQ